MVSLFWYYASSIFLLFLIGIAYFILFLYRIITLLTSQIKGRHCRENAQRWKKAYFDMLIVFIE